MAFFRVLPHGTGIPTNRSASAYLLTDNWNDWFKYTTLYSLVVFDDHGERHSIGGVKIGQFGMAKDQSRADLDKRFDTLDERFFSLGQDDSYYSRLNELGEAMRIRVLEGLRDVALDAELFEEALAEDVMGISLLRSVARSTVTGQFRRMAAGGARLTEYEFSYTARRRRKGIEPLVLQFSVAPESRPPTNVHVLVGRNGIGKTTLLDHMARAIVEEDAKEAEVGSFAGADGDDGHHLFAGLVSVAFSAFDPFEPLRVRRNKAEGTQYHYVGLKQVGVGPDGKPKPPKTPEALSSDFGASVPICRQEGKVARWRRALEMLQADPIFRDADVTSLARPDVEPDELEREARKLFRNMSSGHKIVLLTVTRLVETVGERTLVLLDEPEAHLHPPLLAAFVRVLSDLLVDRNGVALIATHSPVVLQEVPQSCVWKIRRVGLRSVAERSEVQTFGEGVGLLTREVFGLEVTQSGFYGLLGDAVARLPDYESVVRHFNDELGDEARAIVQGLLTARDGADEDT